MNLAEQLKSAILELETALQVQNPRMKFLLRDIHEKLKNDPDTVTLLSPEDLAVIVSGLKRQTATEIATAAIKKPATKRASKITLDDL